MTLVYLTDDCIYYILYYLQNNHSTLFNCLLVNRFWCKSTIPLLYANPFANISKKRYLIISTLIFCFDKTEISQLKNQLGLSQVNNIIIDEGHKPLFEYLKYLEDYKYSIINSVIYGWFAKYHSGLSSFQKLYNDIIPIFHQSILRQSRNIKQLDILSSLFYREGFKNFNIQNLISNLTELNSLSLNFCLKGTADNELEQKFLRNIANTCLNLRILKVTLPQTRRSRLQRVNFNNLIDTTTLKKLCAIIKEQNKLEIFEIWNCNSLLNNILLSLEFQKHSLVHIEIMSTDFSNVDFLKRFNNLHNLECLKFGYCKGILLNQCESLNFVSFKLKELEFIRNYWNIDVTFLMIKYLGAPLQRLFVENPTILLIDNISIYCPNLISLKIRINNVNIDLSFLSSLKKLRIRILNIIINNNINDFFINLANNIPININKISINGVNINEFLQYKEFLENCHNSFEMINLNYSIDYEILKIVLNYIERSNNNLKIIGIMGLDKKMNDEELKLLDQIKAKGVKIVEYYTDPLCVRERVIVCNNQFLY
ncbi:uncharacterized protein OCT59_023819 [Rhizophagus irregularis]|uniref:F-box domain-containing protein n=2 Tax=Rhizophagus irregularis TaxID=588596 RepID=A0A015MZT3_RHIIW|nr:hypothetical protein GLOIN_2v1479695 [Rhizophagus irregularis DAOM 181602=DAOM 197198]EXX72303.1 hypothetical protein RirG_070570 [Rhizophagus irregularis DAOM 197198w]POG69841.1 hypothetical protein GLOIN_2v1479695 [Rhizophagus irregularis DAOM 181602=DAOM 197198]UZO03412.1 hypothetical protein OCT59_023819 [Rhizophagus irregularis]|eukprot:XP_025176707.1 hypothetical protein GLOIN_2v1479695 [Rhizophagus irregularis DAOM 181602=DAOM 197198]